MYPKEQIVINTVWGEWNEKAAADYYSKAAVSEETMGV